VFFVIDALVWTRDGPIVPGNTVTRLSGSAVEDPASVTARIDKLAATNVVVTWSTVVDAADFAALDPQAAQTAPEFAAGSPVWIVRRLIHDEIDGRQRLAVQRAYTADGGDRIWTMEFPDSDIDLATSIDLRDPDTQAIVRVFDYDQQIRTVRPAAGLGTVTWQRVGPDFQTGLQVARGPSDRDVAIRWTGGTCDPGWQIRVHRDLNGQVRIEPSPSGDPCQTHSVVRKILLTFNQTVDLDRIRTGDPCCG
jgi:hypothetical protein